MILFNIWYFVFVIGVTLSSEDNDPPDRQEKSKSINLDL